MSDQRPTKKQKELLNFIDGFIKGNGYGPSYREVMRALGYKSVSTVAAHVNQLILKGYLEKATYSPRSLSVVNNSASNESKSDKETTVMYLKKELSRIERQESPPADYVAALTHVLQTLEEPA